MPNRHHVAFPSRRRLLTGAVGGSFLALSARAGAARPGVLRPGDLASPDGTASALARARAGSRVAVQGYLAPSLDGRSFLLNDGSPMPCGLCGTVHDAGASLAAYADDLVTSAPEIVIVEGRLALDSMGRPTLAFAPTDLRAA